MGAVCCAVPNQMPEAPVKKEMVLFADIFDADTRTLLAINEITESDLRFE